MAKITVTKPETVEVKYLQVRADRRLVHKPNGVRGADAGRTLRMNIVHFPEALPRFIAGRAADVAYAAYVATRATRADLNAAHAARADLIAAITESQTGEAA